MKSRLQLMFLCLICSVAVMAQAKKELKTESDGFQWYRVTENGFYGAQDKNGKTLIPLSRRYDSIFYSRGYLHVRKNSKQGVCDVLGKEIIPPVHEIASIHISRRDSVKWCCIKDNGHEGVMTMDGKVVIPTSRGYESVCYLSEYYSFKKDGKEGACDIGGKEIIPTSRGYESVSFHSRKDHGYYSFKKDGKEGACDIDGKEIIPTSRGYNQVYFSDERNHVGWYHFTKDGKDGACDIDGKEIIPANYSTLFFSDTFKSQDANGNYYSLGISLDSEGHAIGTLSSAANNYASNTSASTASSVQSLFELAYNTPDSETQTKYDRYKEVIKVDPDNREGYTALAWNNIGVLYEGLNDLENAKTCYGNAVVTDGNFEKAKENLANVKAQIRRQRRSTISEALSGIGSALGTFGKKKSAGNSYNGNYSVPTTTTSSTGSSSSGGRKKCTVCVGTGTCSAKTTASRHRVCHGSGKCSNCNGEGVVLQVGNWNKCTYCNGNKKCSMCKGTGKCTNCGGSGYL